MDSQIIKEVKSKNTNRA